MDQKRPPTRWTAAAQALVAGMAILLGLVAMAACIWRPDVLAALTLVPPWCWLVPGLLSAALMWRLRQPRVGAALAGLWTVFAIGCVEEIRSTARFVGGSLLWSAPSTGQALRIVTLNCGGSERCLADLERVHPDIVLVQEVPSREALVRMTKGLFGDEGDYCTAGDVAILARGKVNNAVPDQGGIFVTAMVHCRGGREIKCTSVRLAPPPSRLDPWTIGFWEEHRQFRQLHRRQLAQLPRAALAEQDSLPVVVGGDFNTLPMDAALDGLRQELADAFASSGSGWGATGTNNWPLFRVDQIWTSARLIPQRTVARTTAHSDHRMVICDVARRP